MKIFGLKYVLVFALDCENHSMGPDFRGIVVPEVGIVPGEIRVARNPEFDGVGLPVEIEHSQPSQDSEEEADHNDQHGVPGHHLAVPEFRKKKNRFKILVYYIDLYLLP